jgi:hypothetical protein
VVLRGRTDWDPRGSTRGRSLRRGSVWLARTRRDGDRGPRTRRGVRRQRGRTADRRPSAGRFADSAAGGPRHGDRREPARRGNGELRAVPAPRPSRRRTGGRRIDVRLRRLGGGEPPVGGVRRASPADRDRPDACRDRGGLRRRRGDRHRIGRCGVARAVDDDAEYGHRRDRTTRHRSRGRRLNLRRGQHLHRRSEPARGGACRATPAAASLDPSGSQPDRARRGDRRGGHHRGRPVVRSRPVAAGHVRLPRGGHGARHGGGYPPAHGVGAGGRRSRHRADDRHARALRRVPARPGRHRDLGNGRPGRRFSLRAPDRPGAAGRTRR